jgi:hypothetical protein
MFALVKQRGMDPLEPEDGIQWAENIIGEVPAPVILQQINTAVGKEGPGVRVTPETVVKNGKPHTIFKTVLTNAV